MTGSPSTPPRPYDIFNAPTSSGRTLLSSAFTHWCLLHWGIDESEIPGALDGSGDKHDVKAVGGAARLLGHLFADGAARTSARAFGGGPAITLEPQHWELDDHRPRFFASALNLRQPWDRSAEDTHWIFVDTDDFNRIVEASCADVARSRARRPAEPDRLRNNAGGVDTEGANIRPDARDALRLVRMPDVRTRTGLGRSTIYKKMGNGTFPKPVVTGSFLAWREAAIDDWLADPR